jgi:P pilus assembly chaperone PapD
MRGLLVGAILFFGLAGTVRAQGVVVAPHAVYMDARTRSASVTLYNPGTEPAEVTISSFYGYPVTDSLGQFMLAQPDSVVPSMPSAAGWIEAFPRRMTIPPLQRQTIRLLARPPQGLADGEYWSRLIISAKGGSVPVTGVDSASNISVSLNVELRTIIPLIYRKGRLETGIAVSNLRVQQAGDSIVVRARLERQGTSAYIGTARGTLVDDHGKTVGSFERPVAIYYDADPAFGFKAPAAAGRYLFRLDLVTERTDIAPEDMLRAPPVRDSIGVTLP